MILITDHISPKKKPKEERSAIQKAKRTSVQNRLARLSLLSSNKWDLFLETWLLPFLSSFLPSPPSWQGSSPSFRLWLKYHLPKKPFSPPCMKYSPSHVFIYTPLPSFTFSLTPIFWSHLVSLCTCSPGQQSSMGAGSLSHTAPSTMMFIVFLDCVGQEFMTFLLGVSHELLLDGIWKPDWAGRSTS